jgi:hypothetical protein
MALRTVRLLGIPVQDKGLQIVALAGLMLPAIGAEGGPHHSDLMLGLGRHQEVGIHIAAVEQVGSRQQVPGGSIVHDRRPHDTIRRGGRRRERLSNQIGLAWITGLREMHLIAHPMRVAFAAVPCLQVVR